MFIGSISVGVNELRNSGLGHGFLGFSTSKGSIEIHGQPLGGASPGGLYAAVSDRIPIEIDERRVTPNTPVPHNTVTIANNVPDRLVNDIRAQVLQEAKAIFGLAEYQNPVIDGPAALVQNSNTVAQWALARTIELLIENGIPVNPTLNLEAIAAGLYLPGAGNDASALVNVGEEQNDSNFLNSLGEGIQALGTSLNNGVDGVLGFEEGSFGDFVTDVLTAPAAIVGGILTGEAFSHTRLGGIVDDGHTYPGQIGVQTTITGLFGNRVYAEGDFKGQDYQAGGDVNDDGHINQLDRDLRAIERLQRQADYPDSVQSGLAAGRAAQKIRDRIANDEAHERPSSAPETSPRPRERPADLSAKPVLLDLNGTGVQIADLSKSTQFIDAGGDGLKHRSAWAAAGDGVLFVDADGDGKISDRREYVFTDWAPGAGDDMEALRAAFDGSGEGKLTAADARFSEFKVLVTGAGGATSVRRLVRVGIGGIELRAEVRRGVVQIGAA